MKTERLGATSALEHAKLAIAKQQFNMSISCALVIELVERLRFLEAMTETETNPPEIGTKWVHHTSNQTYQVQGYTNLESTNSKHPLTITYSNVDTHTLWSRPASDWHRSFTKVPDEE